jgi:hypothetical protein
MNGRRKIAFGILVVEVASSRSKKGDLLMIRSIDR